MEDYTATQVFSLNGDGETEREQPNWPVKEDVFSFTDSPAATEAMDEAPADGPAQRESGQAGRVAEDAYNALTWNESEEQENLTWQVQADLAELESPAAEEAVAGERGSRDEAAVGDVGAGRLVVDRLPLLRPHRGTAPDLVLKWNSMPRTGPVDIVVHLHGYSGRRDKMNLLRDKEPASGLDFADPANPSTPGSNRPTLAVLPRGHYFGGNSGAGYSFPELVKPNGLKKLIASALEAFNARTGASISQGKLILTAHSGGGAALMAILKHTDPDEVFTFDALYSDPSALIQWARRRHQAGSGALRVIYRSGEPTARNSLRVATALKGLGSLPAFRVEATRTAHNDIPRRFGWRLLADPAADLANATAREAEAPEGRAAEGLAAVDQLDEAYAGQPYFGESGFRFEEPSTFSEADTADSERDESEDTGVAYEAAAIEGYEDYAGFAGEAEYESEPEEGSAGEAEAEAEAEAGEWELAAAEAEAEDIGEHEAFPSGQALSPTSGKTGKGEEHWDPNNTGLPLYETGPGVRGLKLSPNFTVGELVFSGNQYADKARISPLLVAALQKLRDRVGRPVRITSGYRSWDRNVAVYRRSSPPKTPTLSRHCSGQAADITVAGMTGMAIAKAAVDALGDGIGVGIGASFAHIDVRGTWTSWTYLPGAAGKAAVAEINEYRRNRSKVPSPAPSPLKSDRAAGRVVRGSFTKCSTGEQPGARAMADQWRRLTGRHAGTYNCRKTEAGTPSLHGEGRSVDLHAMVNRPIEKAQADAYVAWLKSNAVELQVAYLIWNHNQWSWARRNEGWRPYPGANKHIDHIHVDLSWEGARNPSPLFSGTVPGISGLAAPPQPKPPPSPPGPPRKASAVPAHVADFVRRYAPHAQRSQANNSVPWLVTLGQAALESGWGKKAPRFNFFGIKAKSSVPESQRQLLQTREVLSHPNGTFPRVISVTPSNGRFVYIVMDWFRAYGSAEESFADHGAFLRRNARYRKAFDHTGSPYAFANAVAAAGYATDPGYAATLTSVMRLIERANAAQ